MRLFNAIANYFVRWADLCKHPVGWVLLTVAGLFFVLPVWETVRFVFDLVPNWNLGYYGFACVAAIGLTGPALHNYLLKQLQLAHLQGYIENDKDVMPDERYFYKSLSEPSVNVDVNLYNYRKTYGLYHGEWRIEWEQAKPNANEERKDSGLNNIYNNPAR